MNFIQSPQGIFLKKVLVLFLLFFFSFYSSVSAQTQPFYPETMTGGLYAPERGISETDEVTGAFTHSIPVVVPAGRNGLTPDVKINYNNQQVSNVSSIVGYGWSLNIPYIDRINRSGTDKLYTDNYFYSTLSGELVLVSGNTYAPKAETGAFLVYT